jgi:photosystem II stability/assembly factor-like uncharacterized protein
MKRLLLLAIGLSITFECAAAQGPREITALLIDPETPTTIYAGTHSAQNYTDSNDGGVYKSTDGGQSWSIANSGMGVVHVRTLAIDPKNPSTVFAGTRDRGIFRTSDKGRTWEPVNSGLNSLLINVVTVDPVHPEIIYAGTRDQGVFKSTDRGQNWEAANMGITSPFVQTLAIDPVNPTVLYAGTRAGGVWKEGADFSLCRNVCPGNNLAEWFRCNACRDSRSEESADGIFKSLDAGKSWFAVNSGLTDRYISALAIDPADTRILYASTDRSGIYWTTDAGESWNRLTRGRLNPYPVQWSDVRVLAIDAKNPATIFAGTWGWGIFKSVDRGQNWVEVNTGLSERSSRYIYSNSLVIDPTNPDNIYAGSVDQGVFKSTIGGGAWQKVSGY